MQLVPDEESLVLRVQDADNLLPGDTVDVEIRTYNPKPISQGQVCLRYEAASFQRVDSVRVYSDEPDVSFTTEFTIPGVILIDFSSVSASVNRVDGPMIAVSLVLAPDLPPGLETWVDIDLALTSLLDEHQVPIPYNTRNGEFTIAE